MSYFDGMTLWLWLVSLVSMAVLDIAWVLYMRAAGKHQAPLASFWALALHLFGAIAVVAYVEDPRYLTATGIGTVVGTFIAVRWSARREAAAAAKASEA